MTAIKFQYGNVYVQIDDETTTQDDLDLAKKLLDTLSYHEIQKKYIMATLELKKENQS